MGRSPSSSTIQFTPHYSNSIWSPFSYSASQRSADNISMFFRTPANLNALQIYWGCLFQYDLSNCTCGNAWKNYIFCTFFCLILTVFVKRVLPWLFILIPKVFGKEGFILGSHVFVMVMLLLLFMKAVKNHSGNSWNCSCVYLWFVNALVDTRLFISSRKS